VFIPIEFCLAFTPAKSIYVFMSEKDGSNIQNVDSGHNGQNQKIIRIQMNLAGAFVDAKQYDLAIVTYTQIINDNPCNGYVIYSVANYVNTPTHKSTACPKPVTIGYLIKITK
jgi:hypothetical protein